MTQQEKCPIFGLLRPWTTCGRLRRNSVEAREQQDAGEDDAYAERFHLILVRVSGPCIAVDLALESYRGARCTIS